MQVGVQLSVELIQNLKPEDHDFITALSLIFNAVKPPVLEGLDDNFQAGIQTQFFRDWIKHAQEQTVY